MENKNNQMLYRTMTSGEGTLWSYAAGLDDMRSPGCYILQFRHCATNLGLPLPVCDEDHYITANLIVTESGTDNKLQKKRLISQTLILPLCNDGKTHIYTRTLKCVNNSWQPWVVVQQNIEVGQVTSLDVYIDSGTYNGVYSVGANSETFSMVVIDNEDTAKASGNVRSVCQFKYSLNIDGTFSNKTRTGQGDTSITWGEWVDIGAADTTDIQDNSITAQKLSIDVREKINGLDDIKSNVLQTDTVHIASAAAKMSLGGRSVDGTNTMSVDIPVATETTAGIMSAEDRKYLNNSAQGMDVPMLLRTNYYNPDEEDFVAGKYLNANGSTGDSSGYCITGYIPLNAIIGELICTRDGKVDSGNHTFVGFYDANKQPLYFKQYSSVNGVATWQYGVAYVRFSIRLYNLGYNQIEQGNEYTSKIGYGESVWSGVFPQNCIEPESLAPIFGAEKALNLINPSELQKGKAAYVLDGELKYTNQSSVTASGLIEVKPKTTYTFRYSFQYILLDSDKKPIGESVGLIGTATVTMPENCRYIVINFYNARSGLGLYNLDATARMYEGDILYPYIPYGVASDKIQTCLQQQTISSLGNGGVCVTRNSVTSDTAISTSNHYFPQSIKNNQISFYGKFDTFGVLKIGRGFTSNAYSGCRFEITDTAITLFKYDGGWKQMATVEHGLTMNTYIKVLVSERKNKVLVSVQTFTGSFEHEFDYWSANGLIAYLSSTVINDALLSVSNPTFKCPVWMFGDSYYGVDGPNRQLYWLRKWGYDNTLVQAFGGQGSNDAYKDLLRCLDFGTPKYLVWSLGMNDDNGEVLEDITAGAWYATYQKLRNLCEVMDIELVLTTIPEVRGNYPNKDAISEIVRNSGLRYIDLAKAVGSNANGEWYGNGTEYDYQSSDDVHPTELGAKAMAMQFLVDFPEIMQY